MTYLDYPVHACTYLSKKDKKMAWAIDRIGSIQRPINPDLFSALITHIIGQQISTKAQATLCQRLHAKTPLINADTILALGRDELQGIGISYKKADYILAFADKVASGEFDLLRLHTMNDEAVIKALSSLNGVGVWTAEMLMIFSMGRMNVLSFQDLAIIRGLRILYRHRTIDKPLFLKYKKRYTPYGTVASLYLWQIAGGGIDGLTDPAGAFMD